LGQAGANFFSSLFFSFFPPPSTTINMLREELLLLCAPFPFLPPPPRPRTSSPEPLTTCPSSFFLFPLFSPPLAIYLREKRILPGDFIKSILAFPPSPFFFFPFLSFFVLISKDRRGRILRRSLGATALPPAFPPFPPLSPPQQGRNLGEKGEKFGPPLFSFSLITSKAYIFSLF